MSNETGCSRFFQISSSFVFDIYPLGVWISDKTILVSLCRVWLLSDETLLVFDTLLLGVWISDETLLLVFHTLLLGVWISDKRLLVFDVLLLSVWISKEKLHVFLTSDETLVLKMKYFQLKD